jgi:nitrite reductase (NO-forming)
MDSTRGAAASDLRRTQLVIDPSALRRRPVSIDRSGDRAVAVAAIALAVGFLISSVIALALPVEARRGAWLPLHLALAGGASSAIAGVMPFFAAAFAAAPPSDIRLRFAALVAVALGSLGVAIGVGGSVAGLAVAGGVAYVVGVLLTGVALVRPLQHALGASRGIVTKAYVVALAAVAIGVILSTLLLAGWPPVADAWFRLKPAHAWLNLVGFVSLVIATTLLHFFPTVIGARIAAHPSARVAVVGLAAGAAIVALGYAAASDVIVRIGALGAVAGASALAIYAWRVWPTRGRWTTDRDWHRFAMGGLISAMAWFEVGIVVLAGRALAFGAAPAAWSIETVVAPLVGGWVGIAVLASATHLLPAVGPGDPVVHGRQRALLGRQSVIRLALLDLGVATLSLGIPLGVPILVASGSTLAGAGLLATALLLGGAVTLGVRARAG